MKLPLPFWGLVPTIVVCLLLIGTVFVAAQEDTVAANVACEPVLEALWTSASTACLGSPVGYICNGGSAPVAEPAGPVSNALAPVGALVETQVVDSIHTPAFSAAGNGGGIAWLRLADFVQMTGLMIGDVRLRDVTPPDFPAWQSIMVETNPIPSACSAAPDAALIVQSILGQSTRVVVNGVSLDLNGTVLVRTVETNTIFTLLSGQLRVLALGQVQALVAGQQVSVPYPAGDYASPAGIPSAPQPLDPGGTRNLPIFLLDRPVLLPQPGFVTTQGAVNLRGAPTTNGALLAQVQAGEVMKVLGRNPAGDWYHVERTTGETGWMFADLLVKNVGAIQAVYESTPMPPQRFGQLGLTAIVNAPLGVNLRAAPDISFGIVTTLAFGTEVNLLARSPYSPWVKVEVNGIEGWLALLVLDTKAVIDALPIEYNVPPPPQPPPPTQPPGSFGNAFPDPTGND